MKALLFLMITTLLTFGAPNVVADDLQTASAAEFGVERPPPFWPGQEPTGPFMMVAMIIPVFVLLAMAIQLVTFAYRSARSQIWRKLTNYRHRGAVSAPLRAGFRADDRPQSAAGDHRRLAHTESSSSTEA